MAAMDSEEEDEGPDGIIVMHYPADGSDKYGVGPFPPIPELVDYIIDNAQCTCRREPVAIVFPKGTRMLVGVDIELVIAEVHRLTGETHDRLN